MARVIKVLVILSCFISSFAREILHYVDGTTMRREDGQPGSSVRGSWSWMDENGIERNIRYVADTNGFRAFGDLVPDDWTTPDNNIIPEIGSSVVPAMNVKLSAINGNSIVNTEGNARKPKGQMMEEKMKTKNKENDAIKSSTSSAANTSAKSSKDSTSPATEAAVGIEKLTKTQKTPERVETSQVKMSSKAMQEALANDEMNISFIPGTNIVLISKRLPITFATEIPSINDAQKIMPVPVAMTGSSPKTITGILTDPRAKFVLLKNKKAKSFPTSMTARRAPKPSKVDGTINLDNFLRPSHLPNSNPLVSLTPNPVKVAEDDYYYYDYYYDDILDGINNTNVVNASTVSPATSVASTTKQSSTTTQSTTVQEKSTTVEPITSSTATKVTSTTKPTIPLIKSIMKRIKSKWQRSTRSEESLEDSDEDIYNYEDSDEKK